MKKTLLKTVVAAAVATTAVSLCGVSAWAANGDAFTVRAEDFYNSTTSPNSGNKIKPDNTSFTKEGATITAAKNGSYYYQDFGTKVGVKKITNGTGKTFTYELCSGGSERNITVTSVADGTLTFYTCNAGSNTDCKVGDTTLKTGESGVVATEVAVKASDTVTASFNTSCCFFGVDFVPGKVEVKYYPTNLDQTESATEWLGGTSVVYFEKGAAANGAEVVGGKISTGKKVRLGKDALAKDAAVTSANMGYITFPGVDGDFNVTFSTASSGTAVRPYCLGTFANGTFTIIADLNTLGQTEPANQVYTVEGGSKSTTYALYLEPKSDGKVADNTDIYGISVVSSDGKKSITPAITLSNPTVVDGKLSVTGTFAEFTGSLYQIDTITLNAALGKDTQEAATWKANSITNLKNNGDGTVSFTATVADPGEKAVFQAVAHYAGVDTLTESVDTNAVSNVAIYTAE